MLSVNKVITGITGFWVGLGLLAGSIAATAQELEEIIVTATKRETTVQDIPISIQVVSGDALDSRGITNLEELAVTIPNLEIGNGLTTDSIGIRGIASQSERSIEQSVGMFIDGVYMPRSRQYRSPFMDVERVEVLRGPQAVIFGLNATAGAISIVSKTTQPGDPFVFELNGDYEVEHGGPAVQGIIGGSPSDALGVRLVVKHTNRDGYFTNDFNGEENRDHEETIVRGTAVWEPTDNVAVTVKAERGQYESDGSVSEQYGPVGINQLVALGFPAAFVTDDLTLNYHQNMDESLIPIMFSQAPPGGEPVTGDLNRSGTALEYFNVSINADLEVGNHIFTVLAANSEMDFDLATDLDGTFLPILDAGIHETFEQQSIEARLASDTDQPLEYLVGFYYHNSELFNAQPNILEPTFTTAFGAYGFEHNWTSTLQSTEEELWSVFATATYNVSDQIRITGGVRYVDTEKDHEREGVCAPINGGVADFSPAADLTAFEALVGAGSFFCPNFRGYTNTLNFDDVLPEVSAQYDVTEDIMLFAKYGQSAKSGGFAFSTVINTSPDGSPQIRYDDEQAETFEAGFKANLLDGAANLNFTFYHTEFEDLQVNTFDPVTAASSIQNAAKATSYGIEVDGAWQVNEWLRLSGAFAWLDNEFDSFPDAPCPISEQLKGTPPPCDASGSALPFAPDFSGSVGFDAEYPMSGSINLVAGLHVSFKDDYIVDPGLERSIDQDSYASVGANVGIEAADGRWGIGVTGRNLTNEKILGSGTPFFTTLGFLKQPRMIFVQARYRFGGE